MSKKNVNAGKNRSKTSSTYYIEIRLLDRNTTKYLKESDGKLFDYDLKIDDLVVYTTDDPIEATTFLEHEIDTYMKIKQTMELFNNKDDDRVEYVIMRLNMTVKEMYK